MRRIVLTAGVVAAVVAVAVLLYLRLAVVAPPGTLYGNVELRQVDLAFNAEGTVQSMAKREGELVKTGELLAELDPATYRDALALAQARRDAAKAQLDMALAGTRAEEIDRARATLAANQATVVRNQATFDRQADLVKRDVSSRQEYDDARMALDAARAQTAQAAAALAEAVAGPRSQEIDTARATLREAEAAVGLASTQLARTRLTTPTDGVVMTRVIEPGTTVLPTAAIYSVAIAGEVWVRGFAPEPMLAQVVPGTAVTMNADNGKAYHGRIGYVSPAAEFTPKTVETPELRTQLVYRIRIRVEDPDAGLRQGMPLTIHLPAH